MNYVEKSLKIAEIAHAGVFRKYNGEPYINHPKRVASKFSNSVEKASAYLHDVIEDTNITSKELREQGIPKEVIEIIEIITRLDLETYEEFIKRILQSRNESAINIKIADIEDNLSDLPSTDKKVKKYKKALRVLRYRVD